VQGTAAVGNTLLVRPPLPTTAATAVGAGSAGSRGRDNDVAEKQQQQGQVRGFVCYSCVAGWPVGVEGLLPAFNEGPCNGQWAVWCFLRFPCVCMLSQFAPEFVIRLVTCVTCVLLNIINHSLPAR
jgi:hypothetical protein